MKMAQEEEHIFLAALEFDAPPARTYSDGAVERPEFAAIGSICCERSVG
jgi:hypothetical protein